MFYKGNVGSAKGHFTRKHLTKGNKAATVARCVPSRPTLQAPPTVNSANAEPRLRPHDLVRSPPSGQSKDSAARGPPLTLGSLGSWAPPRWHRQRSRASPPRSSSGMRGPRVPRSCWCARASLCASTSPASSPGRAHREWPSCAYRCSTTRPKTCWRTWSPPAPPWRPRCATAAPASCTARTAAAARPPSAPPISCGTAATAWSAHSRW